MAKGDWGREEDGVVDESCFQPFFVSNLFRTGMDGWSERGFCTSRRSSPSMKTTSLSVTTSGDLVR